VDELRDGRAIVLLTRAIAAEERFGDAQRLKILRRMAG